MVLASLAGVAALFDLAALESWAKSAACSGSKESPNPVRAVVNKLIFIVMFLDESVSDGQSNTESKNCKQEPACLVGLFGAFAPHVLQRLNLKHFSLNISPEIGKLKR